MALNKQKKLQYIEQILEEVKNDNIDGKEDSILIEVALDFIDDLKEGKSNENT
ncbi:uncharacterized protein METZ01_LOCUS204186 [marine metagenome]|uniref:Uncharacterized protein n=1 Tax=marine metagenome TaxID=408172 RepID=A0A382EM00_9ZZZZ